jgi:hypothetical protein
MRQRREIPGSAIPRAQDACHIRKLDDESGHEFRGSSCKLYFWEARRSARARFGILCSICNMRSLLVAIFTLGLRQGREDSCMRKPHIHTARPLQARGTRGMKTAVGSHKRGQLTSGSGAVRQFQQSSHGSRQSISSDQSKHPTRVDGARQPTAALLGAVTRHCRCRSTIAPSVKECMTFETKLGKALDNVRGIMQLWMLACGGVSHGTSEGTMYS